LEKGLSNLKSGELLQNIPNPFRNMTKIYCKLEIPALVEIEVYDYTGKIIRIINQGYKNKGTYNLDFLFNCYFRGYLLLFNKSRWNNI